MGKIKILSRLKQEIVRLYVRRISSYGINDNIYNAIYNLKTYRLIKRKYFKYIDGYKKTTKKKELSNKVWWCWLQGEEDAPELCKANLNSLRKNLKGRDIIVITEDNWSDYIDLPDYIIEKYKKGIITRTHFSDILRVQLLVTHGGTWIDSSVLCTGYDEKFFDKSLFVFNNFLKEDKSMVCSSWFITSESNNQILTLTRDLLFEYWKRNKILINYYLFHIMFTIATEKYSDEWKKVPRFSNVPPHILQFEITEKYEKERWDEICKMSSIHKLTQKADFSKREKNSFYDYIIDKFGGN
jgi:hypothetical protein